MAAPSIKDISSDTFLHLLKIYNDVLRAFYKDKVKGDDKKRKEALEDDEWRYHGLINQLEQRENQKGLTKAELERLVKWKITHQTNRPFLLPQIRKNDPNSVLKCTTDAHKIVEQSGSLDLSKADHPSTDDVRKALDKVCELTGVGPATGTLILSVYHHHIPFFEDELFAWSCPDHTAKLKYNTKEYFQMLHALQDVTDSLPAEHASDFEKVAFICQHWDYVSTEEKDKMSPSTKEGRVRRKQDEEDMTPGLAKGRGLKHEVSETADERTELQGRSKDGKRKAVATDKKPEESKRPKRGLK